MKKERQKVVENVGWTMLEGTRSPSNGRLARRRTQSRGASRSNGMMSPLTDVVAQIEAARDSSSMARKLDANRRREFVARRGAFPGLLAVDGRRRRARAEVRAGHGLLVGPEVARGEEGARAEARASRFAGGLGPRGRGVLLQGPYGRGGGQGWVQVVTQMCFSILSTASLFASILLAARSVYDQASPELPDAACGAQYNCARPAAPCDIERAGARRQRDL